MSEKLIGNRKKATAAMVHFCPWLQPHIDQKSGYSELGFDAMLRLAAVEAFCREEVSSWIARDLREALALSKRGAVFPVEEE